ncbi:hypothetical protein BD770DRAFT_470937 [Pilaira anomala]|nr:hypothetical protein BD770DRAFT_470937 [Pilaira anomala]
MINRSSSSVSPWLATHNNVDSLNQVMDSVSVLSETELQEELSIFANAQFTYDVAPGVAIDYDNNKPSNSQQKPFRRESNQPNMHSLLNVKLASLVDNNYHTTMTPDAIESYYDQSPDCSPPNGYHSPNPSPPNGFHSPNPTPPNGYHANSPTVFNGIQGIVNPPITFYSEDAIMGYDEDQFMKTMRVLTNSTTYNEQPQSSYDPMDKHASVSETKKSAKKKRNNSISAATTKKSVPKPALSVVDSEDEENEFNENEEEKKNAPILTKEDKRRRNTAASARFRIKKKLREQALQQTADEMTEKAKAFENRVHELEREVKWLKALIVEKKDSPLEQLLMQQQQQNQRRQQPDVAHRHYRSSPVNYHRSSGSTMDNSYISQSHGGDQQHQQLI